jgi:hypothetical protein
MWYLRGAPVADTPDFGRFVGRLSNHTNIPKYLCCDVPACLDDCIQLPGLIVIGSTVKCGHYPVGSD